MKPATCLLPICFLLLISCELNTEKERKDMTRDEYKIDEELPPSGKDLSAEEREERVEMLITESKKTLDSIDVAYAAIRKESRRHSLSLEEREQVNEALMELNDAKDLILLEIEKHIINELKAKTVSMQTVLEGIQSRSEKMKHIAQTLSRISGVIEKTTNLLAGALTMGIVRPGITLNNP